MTAPDAVVELVERFSQNEAAFKSKGYNEANLRREFIDPLFKALGWDIQNEAGAPEAYKEVVHEASVQVQGAPKAPDYSFRFGGIRRFFVEAKRPSVDLANRQGPAFQLRRYGWSAKLPVSILTDFEELAIYDCRVRPNPDDSAATARLELFHYQDYVDEWPKLVSIFSKGAVSSGDFDNYALATSKPRGHSEVDDEFLEEIEGWREVLAQDIAARNPSVTSREINAAVQLTLDRIIFLRIAEDRGLEEYGQLKSLADKNDKTYSELQALYNSADAKYNSGLFHLESGNGRPGEPDTLTPSLSLDDQLLNDILTRLYYPLSPYEFSVLPPEILGHVYERFLGRTIRLTKSHDVIVEEKPEVRKSGGVYYTPQYIVSDIVACTLRGRLENLRPDDVDSLRILDPACGSGSFLLGAYTSLLNWHARWYAREGVKHKKYRDRFYEGPDGGLRLTVGEKKRILLNNIFGVDIDPQAVEVTKLSLLLKLLENESSTTIESQLRLFEERALPDLAANVKCGNSLVDLKYYHEEQGALFDEGVRFSVNPFDWEVEFPKIFYRDRKGFDVVLGNPPYVFGEYLDDDTKAYFERNYETAVGQYDTYRLFIERAIELAASDGSVGMIVPDALLARDEGKVAREMLLENGLQRVYHCGQVFGSVVNVSAAVFCARKGQSPARIQGDVREMRRAVSKNSCARARFTEDEHRRLLIHASDEEWKFISRLNGLETVGDLTKISRGEEIGIKDTSTSGKYRIIVGRDIGAYKIDCENRFVKSYRKDPEIYEGPKIVLVKTGSYPVAAIERQGSVTMQSVYNLHLVDPEIRPEFLVAVLNSQLAKFYIHKTFTAYKLLYPQLNQSTVNSIPIPRTASSVQDTLASQVQRIENLKSQLDSARTTDDRNRLERQIAALVTAIEGSVRTAFGMTVEERGVIDRWVDKRD